MKRQEDIIGENLLKDEEIYQPQEAQSLKEKILRSKKLLLVIGILGIAFVFLITIPAVGILRAINSLSASGSSFWDSVRSQDLEGLKTNLDRVAKDLESLERSLKLFVWVKPIPFFGQYVADAEQGTKAAKASIEAVQILLPAIEPYADVLGFGPSNGSAQAADGAKTAEERIDFIVQSLPSVLPKLDQVGEKLQVARTAVLTINPFRYPESFRGQQVRPSIIEAQTFINDVATLVVDGKPLLARLQYLLGMDEERIYLVIFQNDKELRPTGGFMTAYSLIRVKEGEIKPVTSDDIYNLDSRYKAHLQAPQPFLDHIRQPYSRSPLWRLRDMNWTPDFKVAMELFVKEAKTARLQDIDGIIAVDTHLLVSILEVTGEIGVPGYGNYSAKTDSRCNCPQVIYELESYADVERPIVWDPVSGKIVYGKFVDNRKAILGPLVNSVIANALAQPKEKVPVLAAAILENLREKHVLFYMFDQKTQEALEAFNTAGRIKDTGGDYLAIVDANLGGRKSNLYVTQEVEDEIRAQKDKAKHKLTITYKNPQPHDGWLNSVLPNYMRVYVPAGAELIDSQGIEKVEVNEEVGKTVFGGFFELRPEGVVKVTLEYKVSKGGGPYTYLIQQQPGKLPSQYTVSVGKDTEEFELKTDKLLRFEQ